MLQTVRVKKKYMKDGVTWLVFMFPFCLWYLILWKVHFLQFFADLRKNLSLLKKLTWMHIKGLVMLFKKTVFFVMLWLTVSDFLLRSTLNSKKVRKKHGNHANYTIFFMYLFSCNCLHHSFWCLNCQSCSHVAALGYIQ